MFSNGIRTESRLTAFPGRWTRTRAGRWRPGSAPASCPAWSAGRRRSLPWHKWSTRYRAALKAAAQAGVSQRAVAAAVARELIRHVSDLGYLLINVDLPGVAEILARQLSSGKDRGKGTDLKRGGGVIGRYIVGRIGPLRVARGRRAKTNKPRTQRRLTGASWNLSASHFIRR